MRGSSVQKRFWKSVKKTNGCWLWTGARGGSREQYGVLWDGEHKSYAHRLVWKLEHGEIPKGLCVLHRCDNPPCVNPEHLFLGTKRDNTLDMFLKGRQGSHQPGTSRFPGVSWDKRAKKWVVRPRVNGEKVYLGLFESEQEAAKAYKEHVG